MNLSISNTNQHLQELLKPLTGEKGSATKHKKAGQALVQYLSDVNQRTNLDNLTENEAGITWNIILNRVKMAIDQDLIRFVNKSTKKLTTELYDNFKKLLFFCESEPGRFLISQMSSYYSWFQAVLNEIMNAYQMNLDSTAESKHIGRVLGQCLLKLVAPDGYTSRMSAGKCKV